jgi:hypothetical protein
MEHDALPRPLFLLDYSELSVQEISDFQRVFCMYV